MAFGSDYQLPFSSYEPHPTGGTMFTPAAGGNPLLVAPGPEADRLKGLIDAAPPPQQLASNAPGLGAPPPGFADTIRARHEAEANDAIRQQLAPQSHPSAAAAAPPKASGMLSRAT